MAQATFICSMEGLFLNLTLTAAMWPSETGTRRHWAEILGPEAGTMRPFSMRPQILRGSCSLFSSSPEIKGITLSRISGMVSKVLPAPEMAW